MLVVMGHNDNIDQAGRPIYLWHHDVHERRFGESLVYFLLSFVPVYKRKRISQAIRRTFEDNGITSYCVYEIYGLYDIMIRAWLPNGLPAPRFTNALFEALHDLGCTRVLPFFVGKHLHHWAWWGIPENQAKGPLRSDIDGLPLESIEAVESESAPESLVKDLVAKHLLRRYEPRNSGIKFFVVIPPPMAGIAPPEDMQDVILKRLCSLLTSPGQVFDPSLYRGEGFAWILIKAKMPYGSYPSVDNLIQAINEMGVEGLYIRTYTYLATGSEPPYTIEAESFKAHYQTAVEEGPGLSSSPRHASAPVIDATAYLTRPEDDQFEVKASLKFDVQRFIMDKDHPRVQNDRVAIEGMLKTVVAFLNSQGGELLIGALEKHRFLRHREQEGSVLSVWPVNGDWIVCGINEEYQFTRDFDGFCLAVTDLIKTHVGAAASAMIGIVRTTYDGRDLAVIRVPRGLAWYYLDNEKFYVRRSGSTIALDGRDRDLYQKVARKGGPL